MNDSLTTFNIKTEPLHLPSRNSIIRTTMVQAWLFRAAAVASALAYLVLMTACSRDYDAWVVNPCSADLRVETYSDPPYRFNNYPPYRSVTALAGSKMKVRDAFSDAGGFDWSVRIVDYGVIAVNGQTWKDSTVTLPNEACPGIP